LTKIVQVTGILAAYVC